MLDTVPTLEKLGSWETVRYRYVRYSTGTYVDIGVVSVNRCSITLALAVSHSRRITRETAVLVL